jgi:sterol desaturase/sphingolipid hydroxylase (fatty acid hydroxylase superfamily)
LSPGHHRAHHADVNRSSGNFALITLWDRLFGTLQPTVHRATPIGVERDYRHGYWTGADLVRDSIEMVREIVRPGDVQDRMGR